MQKSGGGFGNRGSEGEEKDRRPVEKKAPPSRLFIYTVLSAVDDVDKAWAPRYASLQDLVENTTEGEAKNAIMQKMTNNAGQQVDIVCGLLYGMLVSKEYAPKCFQIMRGVHVTRYSYNVACDNLAHVVNHRYPELLPQAKEQLVWVLLQFAKEQVNEAEPLLRNMLRWIAGGDITKENVDLCSDMLSLLADNKAFVSKHPQLVTHSVYTFLRLIIDHRDHRDLRGREAIYCVDMLQSCPTVCMTIGRDLLRVLQDTAMLTPVKAYFEKLLKKRELMSQLMNTRTPKDILLSRLTPRMEHWLAFMYGKVAEKRSKRYLDWFMERYFYKPSSNETLVLDIIRYSCCCFHPNNQQLAQKLIPRWQVIWRLMSHIQTNHVAATAKLALFYDWLFYKPGDNIMLFEPAALLLQNLSTMPKGPKLHVQGLLEFLCLISREYHPPFTSRIQQSVTSCLSACMDLNILTKSPRLLDNRELLGNELFNLQRQCLPALFPQRHPPAATKPVAKPVVKKTVKSRSNRIVLDSTTISNLTQMGFSINACRKAVFYTLGKDIVAARTWLVEHMEDDDFENPLDDSLLNIPTPPLDKTEIAPPIKSPPIKSGFATQTTRPRNNFMADPTDGPDHSGNEDEWVARGGEGEGEGVVLKVEDNLRKVSDMKRQDSVEEEGEEDTDVMEPQYDVMVKRGPSPAEEGNSDPDMDDEDISSHATCQSDNSLNYNVERTTEKEKGNNDNEERKVESGPDEANEMQEKKGVYGVNIHEGTKRERAPSPNENDLMMRTGVKRLKTEPESNNDLMILISKAQSMMAHPDADHATMEEISQLMGSILQNFDQQDATQGQVEAIAGWLQWLLENHPHTLVRENEQEGDAHRHLRRYDQLFDWLLGEEDGGTTNYSHGPWLLQCMHMQRADIGTCLLYYLHATQRSGDFYMAFCATFKGTCSFDECVARDVEQCEDWQVQSQLLVYIFRNMDLAAGSVKLLHLLLSNMDGAQLYNVLCRVKMGQIRLFRESTIQSVMEQSLSWETLEAHSLWQLLHAEAYRGANYFTDATLPLLGLISPEEHSEALSGILLLLTVLPPEKTLLSALIRLDARFSPFPACALAQWFGSPVGGSMGSQLPSHSGVYSNDLCRMLEELLDGSNGGECVDWSQEDMQNAMLHMDTFCVTALPTDYPPSERIVNILQNLPYDVNYHHGIAHVLNRGF